MNLNESVLALARTRKAEMRKAEFLAAGEAFKATL